MSSKYVAILIPALLLGCAASAQPAAHPAAPTVVSDLKAPGDAKVGDRTRCPVSGEEFVVKDDSPHTEYQGKTYYFCCPHCVQRFQADPQKYLGKPST